MFQFTLKMLHLICKVWKKKDEKKNGVGSDNKKLLCNNKTNLN